MTRTLIYARTSQATAVGLFAAGLYLGLTENRWLILASLFTSAQFAWLASRFNADHRREQAVSGQLERIHLGQPLDLPEPCCEIWQHSDGLVHGNNCSLPYDARRAAVDAAWAELDDVCCLRGWETHGETHDPAVCRDQSRSNAA